MDRTLTPAGARRLAQRNVLDLDPEGGIAVKRDVHEFEVAADARAFARAFRDVVTDPESSFGLIRVKRPGDRLGLPFEVGERFQGCFSLEWALSGLFPRGAGAVRALAALPPGRALIRSLEDSFLSNYAEIVAISLEEPLRLEYRYLEGTPIAGRTIFTIEGAGEGRCRVTQVFEYQEVNDVALATFQRLGLKLHDQVVHEEVRQAAERAGAAVLSGTIPRAYGEIFAGAAPARGGA